MSGEWKCEMCGKSYKKYGGLSKHLKYCKSNIEHLLHTDYYKKYINPDARSTCPVCEEEGVTTELHFKNLKDGYTNYCRKHLGHDKERMKNIKKTYEERFEGGHPSKDPNVKNFKFGGIQNPAKNPESIKKRTITRAKNMGKISTNISTSLKNSDKLKEAHKRMKKILLEKYGVENIGQLPHVKEKIKKTFEEKYGCHAFSHSDIIEKRKQTNIERYGVEHPMQNEKIKQKVEDINIKRYGVKSTLMVPEIQEKCKETMIERYGVDHYSKTDEFKDWFSQHYIDLFKDKTISTLDELGFEVVDYTKTTGLCKLKCKKCGNELEEKPTEIIYGGRIHICKICYPNRFGHMQSELTDFCKEYFDDVIENDRSILPGRYELDIVIPSIKLAIEFNGLYWHSESMGKDKNYHVNKTKEAEEVGYQLIHVFEDEWTNNKNIIKSILLNKFGKTPNRYFARKLDIKNIDKNNAKRFLNGNHLQRYHYGEHYALCNDDKILCMLTMSKPRFNKKYEWEIIRFCNKINCTVVGGLSRLLKHFSKLNTGSIITYVDARFGNGSGYLNAGFKLKGKSDPNYFYINNFQRESRIKYQKHKLKNKLLFFDESFTEWENMQINGFDRVWDCGNFIYSRT